MKLPLHPYLVHFPVAFLFLEALLILFWFWKRDERYEAFAYFVLKVALISFPFVMLAGYIDAGGITPVVRGHFLSAVFLLALSLVRFNMRRLSGAALWRGSMRGLVLFLLFLSVCLTGLTAHLGGMMVYMR